jgi:hypothetical protein
VELELTAQEAGTVELEVVDRWDVSKDVQQLMGPRDIRYQLTTVGTETLAAGQRVSASWSFGREPPPAVFPADGCKDLARSHSDQTRDWQSTRTFTRESSEFGRRRSSGSLFTASCGDDRTWRPRTLRRKSPISVERGRWAWIAAWVWAPPGMEVELREEGAAWSYAVGGDRREPTSERYPAWTLRAKLGDRKGAEPVPEPARP